MLELRTLSSENAEDNYNSTLLPEYLKQEMSLEIPGKRAVSKQSDMDMEDPNCEARNIAKPTKIASLVPHHESDMPKKEMEFCLRKEVDFCMNKAVEEIDQPTKIVDIKKETYQVVKDICVDEGFHPQNKDFSYENTTNPMPALEESELLTGKENVTNQGGAELYKIGKIMDKVSEDILLKQEHDHDRKQYDLNDYSSLDDQLKSVDSDGRRQQYFDCSDGQESENQDLADATSSSTLTTDSSTDKSPKSDNNADISSIEGARISSSAGDHTAVDVAILPQSSVGSCGCNAMIKSGPENSSGRIYYTGSQIPYSGSISLRSDSSTASTRSFAFPVLQSEWNHSPVKMAKANRSRYGKSRAWGKMLCCSF